ncbi:GDP-mannose 4,6-dehydratase [Alphaproteobacteria bacterium]|nr:GDP-mannose 4,6-dehydratase [Alphaproteobacteria bacterium]
MKKNKVAFITGITGMVGSHLADYIINNSDWEIVGLIRWRSPLNNISHLLSGINENKRIKLVYGDLKDSISIDKALEEIRPDYVFHLAAQSFPKTSFDAPLDTMDTNIQGTNRVLESLKKYAPKSLIHICSSSEVFGRVPKDKLPIDEECTFHPASPYAISKVGTDLVGRFYAEAYDMNVITTRMFTHTGPRRGDVFAESSFAKQIALAEAGYIKPIVKVGNLKSLRTIADVRDAVRAYFMLLTINPLGGEYYNIGGTFSLEIGELLNYLISISTIKSDLKIELDESRLRPIDADLQIPNTKKFQNHTGWKPEISFEKTMLDLLNYWREKVKNEGNNFLSR